MTAARLVLSVLAPEAAVAPLTPADLRRVEAAAVIRETAPLADRPMGTQD